MTADFRLGRPVWLAVDLGGTDRRLLLDVVSPHEPMEIEGPEELDQLPPDALIVVPPSFEGPEAPRTGRLPQGRIIVPRALLWSLLDPARRGIDRPFSAADSLDAEQELRREGRRFWAGLARFRDLDADMKGRCRSLLAQYSADCATLWDRIESLATSGEADPFAGWQEPEAIAEDPAPLPEPPPADPDELAEWLADPAKLERVFGAGFTPRFEQSEMAREIAAALRDHVPLLLEAGTGVGKTIGYLTPLLARIAENGERAVVSTFTRALQTQILEHDMPRLAPLFPDVEARLLMGRSNYICRRRELKFFERPIESIDDAWTMVSFRLWLAATDTGMREEVERHPALRKHLGMLFDSPEPCSPSICHGPRECYVQRARRLAREAQLVVVNHSLLTNDFAASNALIGSFDHLVVDEAHRLPQSALDTFAISCDLIRAAVVEEVLGESRPAVAEPQATRELRTLLTDRRESGREAAEALTSLLKSVRAALAAYRAWLAALGETFEQKLGENQRPHGRVRIYVAEEAFGGMKTETLAFTEAAAAVGAAYASFSRCIDVLDDLPDSATDLLATHARAAELLAELEYDLRFVVHGDDAEWVFWIEPDSRSGVRGAGATRLDAGSVLRECWLGAGLAPVLTSATLAVGEDFGHMTAEMGVGRLESRPRNSLIASPFDFDKQALFTATPAFPSPERPDYLPAVVSLLRRLVSAVPRKTLVLFTAYHALQHVARELAADPTPGELFAGDDRSWLRTRPTILVQGAGLSPSELIDRFRRERHAVLLGTNTFWEGVDFPGEELEVLVVTKIPFQVPTDPWVEARCERLQAMGENPFSTFTVRDAVLRLRQGIGRLIRSRDDRGAVVLLDSRLHSKSYGITFLNALPTSVHYCNDADDVVHAVSSFFDAGE